MNKKNEALYTLIRLIGENQDSILQANKEDLALAKKEGLSAALLERLSIENRLEAIIEEIKTVAELPDPIGEVIEEKLLPNSLHLKKCRTPIGVIGVIYESRPNVTLEIAALTIKSGNRVILRGGKEALKTNKAFVELIKKALAIAGLPEEAVQLIESTDREEIKKMLKMRGKIDLIIPRGGKALQEFCLEHSTIPVITGGVGICHLFVDESADLNKSLEVIKNGKLQRPTVCNALDTLLVHAKIAPLFVPLVIETLQKEGVKIRFDEWDTEWLNLTLGIKVVESLDEAIHHIQTHGTHHSDGILTENRENQERFIQEVDSAAVYVNASTRFTDGGQFGMGGEVAVSTQKFHARGPMGLKELTSYKWVVSGNYHVRGAK